MWPFELKWICARFLLFVYICIAVGNPIINLFHLITTVIFLLYTILSIPHSFLSKEFHRNLLFVCIIDRENCLQKSNFNLIKILLFELCKPLLQFRYHFYISDFLHWNNWNIIESGVKRHKTKTHSKLSILHQYN